MAKTPPREKGSVKRGTGHGFCGKPSKYAQSDIGAPVTPTTVHPEPPRQGFTQRTYHTLATPQNFAKNLAGGDRDRNEALRNNPAQKPGAGEWDALKGNAEKLSLNKAQRTNQ